MKYAKNAIIEFDPRTQSNNIARTYGAFFLKDKIPVVIKEKTIKGSKKPRHSLNARLML